MERWGLKEAIGGAWEEECCGIMLWHYPTLGHLSYSSLLCSGDGFDG